MNNKLPAGNRYDHDSGEKGFNRPVDIAFIILLLVVFLSGCAGLQTRTRSSVVDYLYPGASETIVQPSIPVLNLPLKVGIAFVPEKPDRTKGKNFWQAGVGGDALTEANKTDLLEKVASNFRQHKFVSEIEVIPSAYLTAGGGFSNLDQIRTMYGIDVIALVSYDQVQFTDEGWLSFTYWTVIGAYLVSGEKNDTSTMLDTAVFDIQSRKMLFRAPGTSNIKGSTTPLNLNVALRADSMESFEVATDNMIANLDKQLSGLRAKIKKNPEKVKVIYSKAYSSGGYSGGSHSGGSYSGGGIFGVIEIALMLLFIAFAGTKNKSTKSVLTSNTPGD